MVFRIEITDFDKDYVSVDFEEKDSGVLVNFNFTLKDLARLKEVNQEATEWLNEQLEKLVKKGMET